MKDNKNVSITCDSNRRRAKESFIGSGGVTKDEEKVEMLNAFLLQSVMVRLLSAYPVPRAQRRG